MTTWPDDAVERALNAFCSTDDGTDKGHWQAMRAALIAAGSPPAKAQPTREDVARVIAETAFDVNRADYASWERTRQVALTKADAILELFSHG